MPKANCPHCRAAFAVRVNHVGRKARCPKCGGGFVVAPKAYAEGMAPTTEHTPFDFDETPERKPPARPGSWSEVWNSPKVPTVMGWCCPALLVAAFLGVVVYQYLYRQLPYHERYMIESKVDTLPNYLGVIGVASLLTNAAGFVFTVATFVVGVVRGHRFAVTMSAVTFVLSWPILCIGVVA